MAIRKRGRAPLACAVWLGLFAAPHAMAQTWWVTDGTTSTVDGQTYDSGITANIDGAAVRVENAGSKAVGTNITVKTGGENAPGVHVDWAGEVDFTDFTVTTMADSANGVYVGASRLSLRDGSVSTDGLSATGLYVDADSNVALDNVDVTAQRAHAVRVSARSTVSIANGTLVGTTGLSVWNVGAKVTATDVDVVASTAHGASAYNSARIELSGGTVTAQGASGSGLVGDTNASIIAKDGIVVTTRGGAAANAASGSSITLDDATLRTTEGGIGILADGTGTIVDANAVTIDAKGVGVQATAGSQVTLVGTDVQSATSAINIDGATLELDGGSVVGNGADVSAISAIRSTIALKGGVDVTGNSNSGLVSNLSTVTMDDAVLRSATRDGALISGGAANVSNSTLEGARWGVYLHSSLASATTVEISDSDIVGGDRAFVMRSYDGVASTASISGGNLRATNATVAAANGINVLTLANGANLQSDAGPIIEVLSDASLAATLDAVDLVGRMQSATTATLNVAFRNASTFDGTVAHGGVFDLAAGTSWSLPGDSDVGSLTHAGTIAFTDPAAFHTLTVRGNYTGTGGSIALNTQLADEAANSDRLHVIGDTSGSAQLSITNRGGAGALTNADGIRVVQIDGASNGTFALSGRVVGGAYDYLLHKGGVADPTDGDWYLRSALTPPPVDPPPVDPPPVDPPPVDPPPVDPPPVDPPPTDPPPTDPPPTDPPPTDPPPHVDPEVPSRAPVYRPEIGAYLANQVAAHSVFRQRRDDRGVTRVGGIERTAWVRALHNDFRGVAGQSQIASDAQANGLEIGSQFGAWQLGEGLLSLGASLGQADVGTREISNATHYYAFGDVRGNAATVFATWLGDAESPRGLSIDLWAQQADFDMEVRGQGLAIERYDARANSVSLETGYAFELVGMADRALYFEPQFQVVHTDYDMDAHVEANGTVVRSSVDGGLAGRVALRLFGDIVGMRPFVEIGARYHDTRQSIAFDGEAVELDLAPVVYETTGGLSVEFGKAWRAWGSVSGRRADSTREVEGQLGLAYRW